MSFCNPNLIPGESGQRSHGKQDSTKRPMKTAPNSSSVNPCSKRLLSSTSAPKWLALAGAGGACLGAAATVDAALVQITQSKIHSGGNFVSAAENRLHTDLTGDAVPDVNWVAVFNSLGSTVTAALGGVSLNAFAKANSYFGIYTILFDLPGYPIVDVSSGYPLQGFGFTRVSFNDATLLGGSGMPTVGLVEILAFAESPAVGGLYGTRVEITRLIFDDTDPTGSTLMTVLDFPTNTYPEASRIPEPSGIALLALGAGGLLMRRRREKASRQAVQDV